MNTPTPISSTPTPTPTQPVPVPKYGDTVVDTQGRTGTAAFDPNTGKALTPPAPVLRYTGSSSSSTPASVAPQDDAALRTQEMQNVQGQIDRINSDFATNLTQTTQNNANLIGSTRAIAARTGNLGSDFGNTNIENAGTKAQANLTKIQEQHTNELQKIYDGVNKDIATKQTAYQTQQNKLSEEQTKNFRDNAFKTVDGLAAKGTSLDTLTQDEYNHLVQSTGMSDGQLRAYYAGKVPADKVLKEQISNGNLIQVTRDPTGQVSVHNLPLGINIPTTYTTTHLPSGQIAFVPKGTAPTGGIVYSSKIKPGDNLDNKMIVYDGPGANKTSKAGGLTSAQRYKIENDKVLGKDLDDAKNAIKAGAKPEDVRERFLRDHIHDHAAYDAAMNPPGTPTNGSYVPGPVGSTDTGSDNNAY